MNAVDVAVFVLALLSGAVAGAVLGRWFAARELSKTLRALAVTAERADVAAAKVERIAADWPDVLKRVERLSAQTQRFTLTAQAAEQQGAATAARQEALEQGVAGAFGITVSTGERWRPTE